VKAQYRAFKTQWLQRRADMRSEASVNEDKMFLIPSHYASQVVAMQSMFAASASAFQADSAHDQAPVDAVAAAALGAGELGAGELGAGDLEDWEAEEEDGEAVEGQASAAPLANYISPFASDDEAAGELADRPLPGIQQGATDTEFGFPFNVSFDFSSPFPSTAATVAPTAGSSGSSNSTFRTKGRISAPSVTQTGSANPRLGATFATGSRGRRTGRNGTRVRPPPVPSAATDDPWNPAGPLQTLGQRQAQAQRWRSLLVVGDAVDYFQTQARTWVRATVVEAVEGSASVRVRWNQSRTGSEAVSRHAQSLAPAGSQCLFDCERLIAEPWRTESPEDGGLVGRGAKSDLFVTDSAGAFDNRWVTATIKDVQFIAPPGSYSEALAERGYRTSTVAAGVVKLSLLERDLCDLLSASARTRQQYLEGDPVRGIVLSASSFASSPAASAASSAASASGSAADQGQQYRVEEADSLARIKPTRKLATRPLDGDSKRKKHPLAPLLPSTGTATLPLSLRKRRGARKPAPVSSKSSSGAALRERTHSPKARRRSSDGMIAADYLGLLSSSGPQREEIDGDGVSTEDGESVDVGERGSDSDFGSEVENGDFFDTTEHTTGSTNQQGVQLSSGDDELAAWEAATQCKAVSGDVSPLKNVEEEDSALYPAMLSSELIAAIKECSSVYDALRMLQRGGHLGRVLSVQAAYSVGPGPGKDSKWISIDSPFLAEARTRAFTRPEFGIGDVALASKHEEVCNAFFPWKDKRGLAVFRRLAHPVVSVESLLSDTGGVHGHHEHQWLSVQTGTRIALPGSHLKPFACREALVLAFVFSHFGGLDSLLSRLELAAAQWPTFASLVPSTTVHHFLSNGGFPWPNPGLLNVDPISSNMSPREHPVQWPASCEVLSALFDAAGAISPFLTADYAAIFVPTFRNAAVRSVLFMPDSELRAVSSDFLKTLAESCLRVSMRIGSPSQTTHYLEQTTLDIVLRLFSSSLLQQQVLGARLLRDSVEAVDRADGPVRYRIAGWIRKVRLLEHVLVGASLAASICMPARHTTTPASNNGTATVLKADAVYVDTPAKAPSILSPPSQAAYPVQWSTPVHEESRPFVETASYAAPHTGSASAAVPRSNPAAAPSAPHSSSAAAATVAIAAHLAKIQPAHQGILRHVSPIVRFMLKLYGVGAASSASLSGPAASTTESLGLPSPGKESSIALEELLGYLLAAMGTDDSEKQQSIFKVIEDCSWDMSASTLSSMVREVRSMPPQFFSPQVLEFVVRIGGKGSGVLIYGPEVIELMWSLVFDDEHRGISPALREIAEDKLVDLLGSFNLRELRGEFLDRCISTICSAPATHKVRKSLSLLGAILEGFPLASAGSLTDRKAIISGLQQKHNLLDVIVAEFRAYKDRAFSYMQALKSEGKPIPADINKAALLPDDPLPHLEQVRARLRFLETSCLVAGSLQLSLSLLGRLFQELYVEAFSIEERHMFLDFLTRGLQQADKAMYFSPETAVAFYQQKVAPDGSQVSDTHLQDLIKTAKDLIHEVPRPDAFLPRFTDPDEDARHTSLAGFAVLRSFFLFTNEYLGHLDRIASDYFEVATQPMHLAGIEQVWRVALHADEDAVSSSALILLSDLYTRLGNLITQSEDKRYGESVTADLLEHVMSRLRRLHAMSADADCAEHEKSVVRCLSLLSRLLDASDEAGYSLSTYRPHGARNGGSSVRLTVSSQVHRSLSGSLTDPFSTPEALVLDCCEESLLWDVRVALSRYTNVPTGCIELELITGHNRSTYLSDSMNGKTLRAIGVLGKETVFASMRSGTSAGQLPLLRSSPSQTAQLVPQLEVALDAIWERYCGLDDHMSVHHLRNYFISCGIATPDEGFLSQIISKNDSSWINGQYVLTRKGFMQFYREASVSRPHAVHKDLLRQGYSCRFEYLGPVSASSTNRHTSTAETGEIPKPMFASVLVQSVNDGVLEERVSSTSVVQPTVVANDAFPAISKPLAALTPDMFKVDVSRLLLSDIRRAIYRSEEAFALLFETIARAEVVSEFGTDSAVRSILGDTCFNILQRLPTDPAAVKAAAFGVAISRLRANEVESDDGAAPVVRQTEHNWTRMIGSLEHGQASEDPWSSLRSPFPFLRLYAAELFESIAAGRSDPIVRSASLDTQSHTAVSSTTGPEKPATSISSDDVLAPRLWARAFMAAGGVGALCRGILSLRYADLSRRKSTALRSGAPLAEALTAVISPSLLCAKPEEENFMFTVGLGKFADATEPSIISDHYIVHGSGAPTGSVEDDTTDRVSSLTSSSVRTHVCTTGLHIKLVLRDIQNFLMWIAGHILMSSPGLDDAGVSKLVVALLSVWTSISLSAPNAFFRQLLELQIALQSDQNAFAAGAVKAEACQRPEGILQILLLLFTSQWDGVPAAAAAALKSIASGIKEFAAISPKYQGEDVYHSVRIISGSDANLAFDHVTGSDNPLSYTTCASQVLLECVLALFHPSMRTSRYEPVTTTSYAHAKSCGNTRVLPLSVEYFRILEELLELALPSPSSTSASSHAGSRTGDRILQALTPVLIPLVQEILAQPCREIDSSSSQGNRSVASVVLYVDDCKDDELLSRMFAVLTTVLKRFPPLKQLLSSTIGNQECVAKELAHDLFTNCLFALPDAAEVSAWNPGEKTLRRAKCVRPKSRMMAYRLLQSVCAESLPLMVYLGRKITELFSPMTKPVGFRNVPFFERRDYHVGLRNLGAICYSNATLQQLFAIPHFR
jgi:hypothetical protein